MKLELNVDLLEENKMNDYTMNIMRIVFVIRECMKETFNDFPMSCCFESSLVAEKVFKELGYDICTIEGEFDGMEHYWNVINGFLCDLSSDQFGEPFGIIEDQKKYHRIDLYKLEEQLEEFNNEEDEDIYEDLKEIQVLINRIAVKCLKRVRLYKCA